MISLNHIIRCYLDSRCAVSGEVEQIKLRSVTWRVTRESNRITVASFIVSVKISVTAELITDSRSLETHYCTRLHHSYILQDQTDTLVHTLLKSIIGLRLMMDLIIK